MENDHPHLNWVLNCLEDLHNEHSVYNNVKGMWWQDADNPSAPSLDDLPAVPDNHSLAHSPRPRAQLLHLLDHGEAHPHVRQFAKHNMLSWTKKIFNGPKASYHHQLTVQMGSWHGGDEELAAVGVGTRIGHGDYAGAGMLQLRMDLIVEWFPIDGGAAPTSARRVTALDHEILDDPVKLGAVVISPIGELGKVPAGGWSVLPVHLERDVAHTASHFKMNQHKQKFPIVKCEVKNTIH